MAETQPKVTELDPVWQRITREAEEAVKEATHIVSHNFDIKKLFRQGDIEQSE